MINNLLPPFVMRERGILVNEVPKIHCEVPSTHNHSIRFKDSNLHIHLQLKGIFSCFRTRKPSPDELMHNDKIFLTPDSEDWNPHCTSFSDNESSMINYRGEISNDSHQSSHLMLLPPKRDFPDISALQDSWEDDLYSMIGSFESSNCQIDTVTSTLSTALNLRGEISTLRSSVANDKTCRNIIDLTTPVIDIFATNASTPRGSDHNHIAKLWQISEKLAKGVLERNSELKRHNADNTLSRHFSTNDRMLRYRRINSVFFTDTMFASTVKSIRQNTCCQVFVSDKGFVSVYPMQSQKEFETALHWFCKQVGVPDKLVADSHKSQTSNKVKRFCDQVGTTLRALERHTPWANRAELYIGILKEAVRKDLRLSNAPMRLWDYAIERRAMIHNLIPRPLFQNKGMSPHEVTFGSQGDISNLSSFGWYEWVYYRDFGSFPENREKLGRALGPSINDGNEMAQYVLTSKATVIPRRTLRRLTDAETHSPIEIHKRTIFNKIIRKKLGDSISIQPENMDEELQPYDDDENLKILTLPTENDPVDSNGVPMYEQPITDSLINIELHLPHGDEMKSAKVMGRVIGEDGIAHGTYDSNPYLNTMKYNVEFSDGMIREYNANVIAENLYQQVDADGYHHTLLDTIVDHRKRSNAIEKKDGYVHTKSGQRRMRMTTAGWDLLVLWRDGSRQWLPLNIVKQSNPVDVADYAKLKGIDSEPAFQWWVPYTLKKRDAIISSANSRVRKITHKYGIELPRNVAHAYRIDALNNNTFWRDAIEKEMKNLKVAFDILPDGTNPPPGYSKSSGHLVFDVRMTFERKARWVKDGHKTPDPSWCTYAGVVSRESVRIALTYAALNGLNICAGDIQNAYLQAPATEKHFIICGPEFGLENVGKRAIIVRALYGGKSAGADYWRHVRKAMDEMGFKSCKADPDLWMRPGTKDNGTKYWSYVLLYVDDILAIMEDPELFIRDELGKRFTVKEKSIGLPDKYLGNKISQVTLENGNKAWALSSSQYIQNAIKNVEERLKKMNKNLPKRVRSPWPTNYRPECDTSPELLAEDTVYYQSLIGVLRWIVELNRVDISMETSAMASMMAMPRAGHLETVLHMFAFLKSKHNGVMVLDPTEPDIDLTSFRSEDWSATPYGICEEILPPNAPIPRGIGFTNRAFVDSDHAGDKITRRSRTGFIVYLNSSPIFWYSKKQTSIETSSFGSEFLAMKQCCEYVRGLRYKLRMMGIPVDQPSYIFGDNQSVLSNTTFPHSVLKKKSSSIAYHFVREGVAKNEWQTTYLNTDSNPADMCTKSLPSGEKRKKFTSFVLHYLYDN